MKNIKKNLGIYDVGSTYIVVKGGDLILFEKVNLNDLDIIHVWISLNCMKNLIENPCFLGYCLTKQRIKDDEVHWIEIIRGI